MLQENLKKLLVLQDRDVALARATREMENCPREEENINRQLTHNSQTLEQKKTAAKKIEAERKDLELQVESKKTLINKYRNQQLQTKKNEEFQALGHEIARAEAEIRDLDDKQLELMERYEAAQKEVAQENLKVQEFTRQADSQKNALRTRTEQLKTRKAELIQEIATLEKDFETPLLERYRRILANKKDAAVVPVSHDNTCGGCHMKIPHQTMLQAKGMQQITLCDECSRILYSPDVL